VTDAEGNSAEDSIHVVVADASSDTVPPVTTITLDGQMGNNGWFINDVTVTLTAADASGIVSTDWQLGTSGQWNPYSGPFVHTIEGADTLRAFSMDQAGNVEDPPVEAALNVDKTPPVVSISADQFLMTRDDVLNLIVSAYDPMPGSGLKQVTTVFNGRVTADGTPIDLFELDLGSYDFSATAEDVAGWTATDSGSIQLIATLDSLVLTVDRLCNDGQIANQGICNALQAKIASAQKSVARGDTHTAISQLNALLHQLQAQRGKHIPEDAYRILNQDVRFVILSLGGIPISGDNPVVIIAPVGVPTSTAHISQPEVTDIPATAEATAEPISVTEEVTESTPTDVPTTPEPISVTEEVTESAPTDVPAPAPPIVVNPPPIEPVPLPIVVNPPPIEPTPVPIMVNPPATVEPTPPPTIADLQYLVLTCVVNNGMQESLMNHILHGQWDLFINKVSSGLDMQTSNPDCISAQQEMLEMAVYFQSP
jgi:FIMAH domain-containing protein